MTASEGHGIQAHHGTLQKQLNLRSLVLFGRLHDADHRPRHLRRHRRTVRRRQRGSRICLPPWRCCSPR